MRLIQRSLKISRMVKNVGRLRQIVSTFSKYGFADLIQRMDLAWIVPKRLSLREEAESSHSTAERLKIAFEFLGPTFVKLGQILSTRPDLLPADFIEALKELQDNVAPLPFEVIRSQIGESGDSFQDIDPQPLASASIGQVHRARLKDGCPVVIKVQRPDIVHGIQTDLDLLKFLAGLLEREVPESRVFAPILFVEEFGRALLSELDYIIEMRNIERVREQLKGFEQVVIPKVYPSVCSKTLLVMEELDGVRLSDMARLELMQVDRKSIIDLGVRVLFKSVLVDGFFHGDLHAGNLFVLPSLPDGRPRLGVIDFGIMGRLSAKAREQLIAMVLALFQEDFEALVYEYAELGTPQGPIDFDRFQREVRNTLSPYLGLALKDLNIGHVLMEATRIATRYRIQIPGDWMLVFKGILTMEGVARSLDPEFDMMKLGQELVTEVAASRLAPEALQKEWVRVSRDALGVVRVLPRELRWFLRKVSANDFAIETVSRDHASTLRAAHFQVTRFGSALLGVAFWAIFIFSVPDWQQVKHLGDVHVLSYATAAFALFFTLRSGIWRVL
jgi:ubiquinone biosynthesis protein